MIYSSIWDGLLKLTLLAAILTGSIWVPKALGVYDQIKQNGFTIYVVIGVFALHFVVHRTFLSILASWLHARVTLRTPVTLGDARRLRVLFQLDLGFHWIPMDEVRLLPKEQRRDALLAAITEHAPDRKPMLF
jgi:hypothetical protein